MGEALRRKVEIAFRDAFGAEPALFARAPGRVNLIGEHTDYNDGFVLPCAISAETLVAARPRRDGRVRVFAADYQSHDEFDLGAPFAPAPGKPWASYVRGMIRALLDDGQALTGADLAIGGDIPQGAGLSSSASLEVATGLAMAALAGAPDIDRTRLARIAQHAENAYAGCRCGIMDQLASAAGVAAAAVLIDCRSLSLTPAPIPADVSVLIVHSGVTRGLVDGEYNARRADCERAARALGLPALRDADLATLARGRAAMDETAFRRARHVVTENRRTLDAAAALKAGDLATLGRLMAASHASMRDDFEITTPEIDALVTILQGAIGAEGGARMTGGGFGGCVVAVLPSRLVERARAAVLRDYRPPDGQPHLILDEKASAGGSLMV